MFIKMHYLRRTLSTLGIISLFIYPAVSSAYARLGSDCTACHGATTSSDTEQTSDVVQDTTTVDTIAIVDTTDTTTTADTTTLEMCTTDPNRKSCQLIAEFDLDQNGQIELAEAKAAHEDFFNTADTDGSATLTAEELEAAKEAQRQARLAERFDALDNDGDSVLSEDELETNVISKFSKISRFTWLDADEDGGVTLEEFLVTKTKLSGHRCGEARFSRLDNDEDGAISKEEFVNNVPLFDRFDADENGVITIEELESGQGSHHGKGRHGGRGGHFRH